MMRKIILAAAVLVAGAAQALAQFADQATFAGTGAGSANAQTITLPNATSYADVRGVLIKFIPGATNTTAATLQITGVTGTPAIRKPNGAGLTALTGGEIVTGQPTYVMYDGTSFDLVSPTSLPIGASQLQNSALSFGVPVNLGITATVGSNQLTVALKGADGNDPSATNPVLIPFRNATISTGTPSVISQQSALSITINSTNTLGCVSNVMCRPWVVLINNAGTAAICLFNARSGTSVAPINEAAVQSSASGTTGGSLAQTYYCSTSSVTAKAIRIIGYIDIQEATAGTWSTGPTYVQLFGPGIKKPGDIVQTVPGTSTSPTTINSTTNTATNVTASIQPTSAANLVKVSAGGWLTTQSNGSLAAVLVQIYRSTGSVAVGSLSIMAVTATSSAGMPTSNLGIDAPNTTSLTQYGVYGKNSVTTAISVFLGTDFSVPTNTGIIILEEIMSQAPLAFDNDNDPRRLNMVG